MAEPLLEISGYKMHFQTDNGVVKAVDGVDITVGEGRWSAWSESPAAERVSPPCR